MESTAGPTFLAIMGPWLIVMVGDNDAGGVSHVRSGWPELWLFTLLWTLLLLIPVLIVNQEMVVRLGSRHWGWPCPADQRAVRALPGASFSVGDLFILNFLTIVTEFIGISLVRNVFRTQPVHRGSGGGGALDRDYRDGVIFSAGSALCSCSWWPAC